MTVLPNRIIWSGNIRRYVELVGENAAVVLEDKYRHLYTWEIPLSTNQLGYSCNNCQGFIRHGVPHICHTVNILKNMKNIKHYNRWDKY